MIPYMAFQLHIASIASASACWSPRSVTVCVCFCSSGNSGTTLAGEVLLGRWENTQLRSDHHVIIPFQIVPGLVPGSPPLASEKMMKLP